MLQFIVQRWDSNTGEIENGTYFGLIAALTFKGPFKISGVSSAVAPCCCCLLAVSRAGMTPA